MKSLSCSILNIISIENTFTIRKVYINDKIYTILVVSLIINCDAKMYYKNIEFII